MADLARRESAPLPLAAAGRQRNEKDAPGVAGPRGARALCIRWASKAADMRVGWDMVDTVARWWRDWARGDGG